MANSDHQDDGAPPRNVHIGPASKKKWLPWLLLALLLLALLFGLRGCADDEEAAVLATAPAVAVVPVVPVPVEPAPATPASVDIPANAADNGNVEVLPGTSAIGAFLSGAETLPRTFVFEQINFNTGESAIRPEDRNELDTLAALMKEHPGSRIRIVGYADARGPSDLNARLGMDRAESVKAGLVERGIAAARLETATGGETNPLDPNAGAGERLDNRRAELIVLER